MGTREHKQHAPKKVSIAVITISTTRALVDDSTGKWISTQAANEGHEVVYHEVIPDDAEIITTTLRNVIGDQRPQVVLMTGGTGITKKDVTIEAVTPLFTKVLTAFGSLFALLSFEEIGSAAFLSRATAGVVGNTVVICMPGSINACKLACRKLIFPELGHLVKHVED